MTDISVLPPLAVLLGMRLLDQSEEMISLGLDTKPEFANSMGSVHGGIILALADQAAGMIARRHFSHKKSATLESKCNFLRSISLNESVVAEARAIHAGRSAVVSEVKIFRSDRKLAAIISHTQISVDPAG